MLARRTRWASSLGDRQLERAPETRQVVGLLRQRLVRDVVLQRILGEDVRHQPTLGHVAGTDLDAPPGPASRRAAFRRAAGSRGSRSTCPAGPSSGSSRLRRRSPRQGPPCYRHRPTAGRPPRPCSHLHVAAAPRFPVARASSSTASAVSGIDAVDRPGLVEFAVVAIDPHLHRALGGFKERTRLEIGPEAPCNRVSLRTETVLAPKRGSSPSRRSIASGVSSAIAITRRASTSMRRRGRRGVP